MLEIEWIVCCDRECPVVNGSIRCPVAKAGEQGHEIRLQDCLDCRYLMATPLDREPQGMCTTDA